MNKEQIYDLAHAYAEKYNTELLELIDRDTEYFKSIMNIEREKETPRKDYEKFGNLPELIGFFYRDRYQKLLENGFQYNEKFDKQTLAEVLEALKDLSIEQDEQSWFENMKSIANKLGFAGNKKEFKENPEAFKGMVGDVAEILRP